MVSSATSPAAHGARCDLCPLSDASMSEGPVAVTPPASYAAGVVFVYDAPGPADIRQGRFTDPLYAGFRQPRQPKLVTGALMCRPRIPGASGKAQYDLRRWLAWFRATNKARAGRGEPPMANPFTCCYPRLQAELAAVSAPVLPGLEPVCMPLGSYALGAVMGEPGKAWPILKYRGSCLETRPCGSFH
jgi:hypothetical protein